MMLLFILQLAMVLTAPAPSPAGTGPPEYDGPRDEPSGSTQPHGKGPCMGQGGARQTQTKQGTLMNLEPLHDRVIVKRLEPATMTPSGIVIPDSDSYLFEPIQGEVLAIGPGRRNDKGDLVALNVKVGDRVLFGKHAGQTVTADGDRLLVLREEEILARVALGLGAAMIERPGNHPVWTKWIRSEGAWHRTHETLMVQMPPDLIPKSLNDKLTSHDEKDGDALVRLWHSVRERDVAWSEPPAWVWG